MFVTVIQVYQSNDRVLDTGARCSRILRWTVIVIVCTAVNFPSLPSTVLILEYVLMIIQIIFRANQSCAKIRFVGEIKQTQ